MTKLTPKNLLDGDEITPRNLLEKSAFWKGFEKSADVGGGGSGFTGTGKNALGAGNEGRDTAQGLVGQMGNSDDTMVDRSMRDRLRGPREYGITDNGQEIHDETNPHIIL